MISFKFIEDVTANFTPSTKISQYAKENNLNCYRSMFGTLFLEVDGRSYNYHHYQITSNGDGTETVEIFLSLAA